ncbi:hypothetical protein HPP92_017578 [Vanilla planifolia]|uniref:K+ potassium transporter C-terminal domain-containing protein n=1 Tax=Vanilla planifolia TaxID=51239 RepID=A0A835QBK0_VANPL|nr:hypothetical protein HPP92_018199 [Vanilla planifolia]KAG0468250.1 hypothetical protein HPP92_017578 [Vanilla planifolia]
MHQVLVFLCVKSVPVPHVQPKERFLVGGLPKEHRSTAALPATAITTTYIRTTSSREGPRLQHRSVHPVHLPRSPTATGRIQGGREWLGLVGGHRPGGRGDGRPKPVDLPDLETAGNQSPIANRKKVRFLIPESLKMDLAVREELQELMEAREAGMAFIMGSLYMKAKRGSSFMKKVAINVYDFLRRNSRGQDYAVSIPHASTLEVGMNYLV